MCSYRGFLFLLRVGELGKLRWADVVLSIDQDGDARLRRTLPKSKTDQYNEGRIKVLKGTSHPLFPVRAMGRWIGIQPGGKMEGWALAFSRDARKSLSRASKLAAVSAGEDFARISNHSLRSGGWGHP